MRWWLTVILLTSWPCTATLSKSSGKEKSSATPTTTTTTTVGLTAATILAEHSTLQYSSNKKFTSMTLGYVTPWSPRGYDLAKWMAHKIDLLAPVWFVAAMSQSVRRFQLTPHARDGCSIEGTHDLDQGWLDDVRSNNSAIKVVPRFIVDKFDAESMRALLTDANTQNMCLNVLVDYCRRNRFSGLVFELWASIMSSTRGEAAGVLIDLVVDLAERLHQHDLLLVLPVPPPLTPDGGRENGMLTSEHLSRLLPFVDYLSVMTYDHPGNQGVSPLPWMRRQIEHMNEVDPDAHSRILMGMNFYGRSSRGAIVGHEYLSLIESSDTTLSWDSHNAEHATTSGGATVLYPSTSSIDARLRLATNLQVGVAIWEMGQGLDYFLNAF